MKVRSGRSIYLTSLTFEEFKLVEFSKDLVSWIPDEQLSCNQCEDVEDDSKNQDSGISFLTKFKADALGNPKKIREEGLIGYILPEGKEYDFRKEKGAPTNFQSIAANHYNLHTNSQQLQDIALIVYSDQIKQIRYSPDEVSDYLLSHYQSPEWANLLALDKRSNWKRYVRSLLLKKYQSRYGMISREDLRKADKLDPQELRASLKHLSDYGCLQPKDTEEIRIALGKDALK